MKKEPRRTKRKARRQKKTKTTANRKKRGLGKRIGDLLTAINKGIDLTFKIIFKTIYYIVLSPFFILGFIIRKLTALVRMSLSFKITFMFSMIFILINSLSFIAMYLLSIYLNIATDQVIYGIASIMAFTLIFGLLIIILVGSKTSKKVLSPLKTMNKDIRDISATDLSKRLDVSEAKDELKDLSMSFNKMITEIQSVYENQSRFVSDASHELRTPIAVIQGYANLLDRWGKNDEKILEESIEAIKSESQNMKDLIEKLLFLARTDKQALNLEKDFFDISEVVDEVAKETEMIDSNHRIISNISESIRLYGDRASIKQAIRIFVENSIKFTPEDGEIVFNVFKTNEHVFVEIIDSGIGIPKEDIPHVFDRFFRSDKSRTKSTGGTGLGLSIAKLILDNHHCLAIFDSEVNKGTRVTLKFKYI